MPWRIPIDSSWSGATGSPGVNIFHVRASASPLEGDFADVLTNLQAFFHSVAGFVPATLTYRFSGVITGVGPDKGKAVTTDTWSEVGRAPSADYMPPAVAALVSWQTSVATRQGRGRTFLGPISIAYTDGNGRMGPVMAGGLQSAVDALVAASTGASNGAVGIWSPTAGVIRDITAGTVRRDFASIRSRRD